jgi:hypothetical protein
MASEVNQVAEFARSDETAAVARSSDAARFSQARDDFALQRHARVAAAVPDN